MTFTRSIRFRLLLMILLSVLLMWAAVLCFTWWRTSRDINNVYDAELVQMANMLAVAISHEAMERDLGLYQVNLGEVGYNFPLIFQIWDGDNRLMVRGPGAPPHPLADSRQDGFLDISFDDAGWRVYTMNVADKGFRVQVARDHDATHKMVSDFVIDVIKPLLLALPLFGMLWYLVHRGFEPLRQVSRLIAERDYDYLEPVKVEHIPEESAGLVDEINALLVRLKESIDRNSHFTADVAHELRTPIAGMLVQLQSGEADASDEERRQVIDKVKTGLKRLSHVVNQLLILASIEPEKIRQQFKPMELGEIARDVISDLSPTAFEKEIELALEADEPVMFNGNKPLMAVLISNLMSNAIKFTPRGGSVTLRLAGAKDGISLSVEDSGPGIPEVSRNWVFERRNRLAGSESGGSGLGLAIVREISRLHQATLALQDKIEGSGLIVNLFLPYLRGF